MSLTCYEEIGRVGCFTKMLWENCSHAGSVLAPPLWVLEGAVEGPGVSEGHEKIFVGHMYKCAVSPKIISFGRPVAQTLSPIEPPLLQWNLGLSELSSQPRRNDYEITCRQWLKWLLTAGGGAKFKNTTLRKWTDILFYTIDLVWCKEDVWTTLTITVMIFW